MGDIHVPASGAGIMSVRADGFALRSAVVSFVCLLLALIAMPAAAQVQRSLVNLSFEEPNLVTGACRVYISHNQVPGWNTTHRSQATENVGGCVVPAGFSQSAPIIEMWRTPRSGVSARSGNQLAELNAERSSRIYQNVCLIEDERVSWRFSHRGRQSSSARDVADMKVGASTTIVRVGTTNSGSFDAPEYTFGTVDSPSPAGGGWVDYRGVFDYPGTTGVNSLGFEAASGSNFGNFLDDIQIELAPFVEFTQPSSSSPEDIGGNLPTLRVNGIVYAEFTVTVNITGGSAVIGTDYETPGNSDVLTVQVPAGNYDVGDSSSLFELPISVIADTEPEDNKTIVLQIQPPAGESPPFLPLSSAVCGEPGQSTTVYTIIDDDAAIVLDKTVASPTVADADPSLLDVVYTVTARNPSPVLDARYSLVDTPGFGSGVAVVSASYRLNGGSPNALPESGPWELQPQWRTLEPEAVDTYVLTVRVSIAAGSDTADDVCVSGAPGNGLFNAVQAVVEGVDGGEDNVFDAEACQNTPTPVWITLRKALQGRYAANDQAEVRIYSGGLVASSAVTAGADLPAQATTNQVVLAAGSTMQFEEAIKTNGTGTDRNLLGYRPELACTNTGTSFPGLPEGSGTDLGDRHQWNEFSPPAGAVLDCTITNARETASLWITKTNTPGVNNDVDLPDDAVVSGQPVVYTIVVGNDGPDSADGAVIHDPVPTGLTCTTASCGNEQSGAECPAATGSALLSALQSSAGAATGVFPADGSVTLMIDCIVD